MRLKKAIELARELGIPRRTMSKWCKQDPELAIKIGRVYYIKLEKLAGRPGISLVDAFTLGQSRWMKATELARLSGISRKTIGNWCRARPGFAKRIGCDWYIDLQSLGASADDMEGLLARLAQGQTSQEETEEE